MGGIIGVRTASACSSTSPTNTVSRPGVMTMEGYGVTRHWGPHLVMASYIQKSPCLEKGK
jgi:hypothetical protein